MNNDYYTTLSVSKTASSDEIKKAYRKLAIKWHPDKNKGDAAAEEQFKKISEAYEVLSDENKKAQYDQFGHAAFQQGPGPSAGGFQGGRDPFDMFDSFFNQGRGQSSGPGGFNGFFTRENGKKSRKNIVGSNLKLDVEVKLKDIIKEKSINLSYTRNDRCNSCDGSGTTTQSSHVSCNACGGRGVLYRNMGIMQIEQECSNCSGSGTMIKNPCNNCRGSGVTARKTNTTVKIPVGCHSGIKLRVSGLGNYDKAGYGDLYVFIHVLNDEIYDRDGDDVIRKLDINFYDLLLGTELEIESLYGNVKVKIPRMSKSDQILKVKDHGVPSMSSHRKGDMFLILNPKFPTEITDEQKSILQLYKKSV